MGVSISHSTTSPFFFTSVIIGFVSFGFTVGTFVKVVWVNLETLSEAPHEVHSFLTTLRTELLEEKTSLKMMRKGIRKQQRWLRKESRSDVGHRELTEISMKTMSDDVRHLIRQFRQLEKPFLEDENDGIAAAPSHRTRARRRRSSTSPPGYGHPSYSSPPEKTHERVRSRARSNHDRDRHPDDEGDDEAYWAQRTVYADFTISRRLIWLRKKDRVQRLYETLSRVQIRRIALQVNGLMLILHENECNVCELGDTVRRIDERTGRIMGVRRVDS